jgi:PAS domain S-box-containing protein
VASQDERSQRDDPAEGSPHYGRALGADESPELAGLTEERDVLAMVSRAGRILAAELDLQKLVQAATDVARELSGAQFAAFFYNVKNEHGESYSLYTISGVPIEAFSKFPMPRNTLLFEPTFRGEGPIRIDDVLLDSRYGKMEPYYGMPHGHLPVRSYLALPVLSRSGSVLGGLFFGHAEPGAFTERTERNLEVLVPQIAVALDNAHLFAQAQREIAERQRAEQALRVSEERYRRIVETTQEGVWMIDAAGVTTFANRRMAEMLGLASEGEMVGRSVFEFLDSQRREIVVRTLSRLPDMTPEEYDFLFLRGDGTALWALVSISPIADDAGIHVGALGMVTDITRRKTDEFERERLLAEQDELLRQVDDAAARQRAFVKEMLFATTDGRLRLCYGDAEMPEPLAQVGDAVELTRRSLHGLRASVEVVAADAGFSQERILDIETGVSEAAMNAIVHGSGGTYSLHADRAAGVIQVWIRDHGRGIAEEILHKATLQRGFSSAGTLGHGFWLILRTCDRVYLCTSPQGTTLVLEQDRTPPAPGWLPQDFDLPP